MRLSRQTLIFILAAILLVVNTVPFCRYAINLLALPPASLKEPGGEYKSFQPFLQNIKKIGYINDLPLTAESRDWRSFLQAQYQLAPIILDYDNAGHKYLILHGSSMLNSIQMLDRYQASAVMVDANGVILAEKK